MGGFKLPREIDDPAWMEPCSHKKWIFLSLQKCMSFFQVPQRHVSQYQHWQRDFFPFLSCRRRVQRLVEVTLPLGLRLLFSGESVFFEHLAWRQPLFNYEVFVVGKEKLKLPLFPLFFFFMSLLLRWWTLPALGGRRRRSKRRRRRRRRGRGWRCW